MTNPKTLIKIFFLTLFVSACGIHHEEPSNNAHLTGWGGFAPLGIKRPQPINKYRLQDFINSINILSIEKKALPASQTNPSLELNKTYIQAATKIGGIPREQGSEVLKALVAPDSNDCGGVSCANIFEIQPADVEPLLDGMLMDAASQVSLPHKNLVLGSLAPEAAFANPVTTGEIISRLFLMPAKSLPKTSTRPESILSKGEFMLKGRLPLVQAIENYSITGFFNIRLVETLPFSEMEKMGMSHNTYMIWRERCKAINEGLRQMPVVKQVVYRGLHKIPYGTIADWVRSHQKGETFYLGPENKPAITSATWDINVAKKFLNTSVWSLLQKNQHLSVLFEIHQHKGVAVQNVSQFPDEREVLLPAWNRFVIEEIAPLGYFKRTVYIRLRGLD